MSRPDVWSTSGSYWVSALCFAGEKHTHPDILKFRQIWPLSKSHTQPSRAGISENSMSLTLQNEGSLYLMAWKNSTLGKWGLSTFEILFITKCRNATTPPTPTPSYPQKVVRPKSKRVKAKWWFSQELPMHVNMEKCPIDRRTKRSIIS